MTDKYIGRILDGTIVKKQRIEKTWEIWKQKRLVLNPPFTKFILNLIGAGDVKLAFEAENMAAYEQRKKDFAEKVH